MPASDPIPTVLARARHTLRRHGGLPPQSGVLVACSGGPDSAALLGVMARLAPELEVRLYAASVDHGLRAGAARDVEKARAQAESLSIPFARLEARVERAGSLQADARRARYASLQAEARRVGAHAIALGHTADDQAETVLARLLKGSGLRGLGAMAPRRSDFEGGVDLVRPLLGCPRSDVHGFAEALGFELARDPSNGDPAFQRTRVRAEVLPALRREDPRVVEHLCALADESRALEAWLAPLLEPLVQRSRLPVAQLSALPSAIGVRVLRAWLSRITGRSPRRAHLEAAQALGERGGEVLLGDGWVVSVESAELWARRDPAVRGRAERGDSAAR